MNNEKYKKFEEALHRAEEKSPEEQKAAEWLIGHFGFALELCISARLTRELREEMREYAIKKHDALSLMLIERERILHPEE